MTVKAKFFLQKMTPSFEEQPEAAARTLQFSAVCRGAENSIWASATPSGQLGMTIRNDLASAQFEVGKEYYLTFEPAEAAPQPGDGHEAVFGMTPWNTGCCTVCGTTGTWSAGENGAWAYVWDEAAQARHDEVYAKKA